MLVDILLLKEYKGVIAGQCTQVESNVAEELIEKGCADYVNIVSKKQTISETKKVGK